MTAAQSGDAATVRWAGMELEIARRADRPPVVHITLDDRDATTGLIDALALAENVGPGASTWIHGSTEERDEALRRFGFTTDRTLLQMRRPLPAEPSGLETRPFTKDDVDELVEVNNRAFAWHPEQAGLTAEAVLADMESDWFDADGFRLHHIDGRLAGFCWTKIHTEPESLGEIYVIALDPDFTGRGLGKPMTLAGLEWLSERGLRTAMLYVESDNHSAVATYEALGFAVHRVDRMWTPVVP